MTNSAMHRNNKSPFHSYTTGNGYDSLPLCCSKLLLHAMGVYLWLFTQPGNGPLRHFPWFIWKMPLSTQLGFVVSCDWHATHGISCRMIVRESHTGALVNKQGRLERHTGCKHWSFYGKVTKGQRETEGEKRGKEVNDVDKVRHKQKEERKS